MLRSNEPNDFAKCAEASELSARVVQNSKSFSVAFYVLFAASALDIALGVFDPDLKIEQTVLDLLQVLERHGLRSVAQVSFVGGELFESKIARVHFYRASPVGC